MNLKPFVNDPQSYNLFLHYVTQELERVHKEFERAVESEEMRKLQGEARVLRRMLKLREKVNERQEEPHPNDF